MINYVGIEKVKTQTISTEWFRWYANYVLCVAKKWVDQDSFKVAITNTFKKSCNFLNIEQSREYFVRQFLLTNCQTTSHRWSGQTDR